MSTAVVTSKYELSVKGKTLATVAAIAVAILLPQVFHVIGVVSGLGTMLGEMFLPMHLPIILVGLLAGPSAGAVAGCLSPLMSFGLTGMPGLTMLPFMMIELGIYGFSAGWLRKKKMSTVLKVLMTQLTGRVVRAIAILISVYGFSNTGVPVSIIWKSIATGLIGLVLQWVVLPFIVSCVEEATRHE